MEEYYINYNLLLEFEFVVDLDLAMYKYMRNTYPHATMFDKEFMSLNDEKEVIYRFLNRKHINPLEIMIPEYDTTNMYYELLDNENIYKDVLSYATAYDTFKLLITWLNNVAGSIKITILCRNKMEADFITKLNKRIGTMIATRQEVIVKNYTALYVKYIPNIALYDDLQAKHIYIAAAKFNMEEDKDMIQGKIASVFGKCNELHLMDLYTKIKYRFKKKEGDSNEDLL